MACPASQSVSPVVKSLRPTTAQMSPGVALVDLVALVRAHLHQAADALALALDRVPHRVAGLELARVDADERERAHERVRHDLERQRAERRVVAASRASRPRLFGPAVHRRHVERGGQVVHHRVQQRLHALVLERGAAEHRERARAPSCPCGCRADLVLGELARPRGTSPSARRPARRRPRSAARARFVGLRPGTPRGSPVLERLPCAASSKTDAFIRTGR